jgi:hypothetical protein
LFFVSAATRGAETQTAGEHVGAPRDNERVVGPGKVHLTLTRDGRWLDFAPVWNGGNPLFSLGGIIVYAKGPDGRLVEIANSATDEMRVGENASRIRTSCEGASGGCRSPSATPDDDHDGRVDEDRLDGIDNDGDGKTDEDFAAIGDDMAATCFFAPAIDGSGAQLAVHQEAYAWALPHIDGTIMLSLRIKNIGREALEGVRVGAFFEKNGPLYFSRWLVSLPGESDDVHASVAVSEDLQGVTLGLVAFDGDGAHGGVWTGGVLENADEQEASLIERLSSTPPDDSPGGSKPAASEVSGDVSVFKSKEIRVDAKTVVYQASPDLGSLAAGDEISVALAFFAVREKTDVEAAAINAFKTFTGDGTNRFLPPPVSMTPRVIWGSYTPVEIDASSAPGVAVEFEPAGSDPASARDVSCFTGIAPDDVEREQLGPGLERVVLRGPFIEKALRKAERIVVKGRLSNGEFFEAILRPAEGVTGVAGGSNAEEFWQTEGRLDLEVDLLTSSPNPFRTGTTISYEIPGLIEQPDGARIETKESLETNVKVYNVVGRLVSVLVEDVLPPGKYTTEWQGVDDQGNLAASGVYYVRLQIGKKFLTQRLILLK